MSVRQFEEVVRQKGRPILVTGSHRSGTTWAGRVLARAPRVGYAFEPFNPRAVPCVSGKAFENWYQYLCEENGGEYRSALDALIAFNYPWAENMSRMSSVREGAKMVRDQFAFLRYRLGGYRPLLKDPIAFFSAEWLAGVYGMDVMVMIRHPAAFCASIKLRRWQFDFNNLLRQPLLMERYLSAFRCEIDHYAKHPMDIVDQGILLWKCIYQTVREYQAEHPNWLFVRHEDLASDPVNEFQRIYSALDLNFTDRVLEYVRYTSAEGNPVEPRDKDQFVRDSRRIVKHWVQRLTPGEISHIRHKTAGVSEVFYSEHDW